MLQQRPWGTFQILHEEEKCKVKKLVVKPGQKLSLQSHQNRNELWSIISGNGEITLDDEISPTQAGMIYYIPVGTKHRLENVGNDDLVVIEVQTGTSFSEEDIIRYEDIYGRHKKDILVLVPHHSAGGRRNKTLEILHKSWKETTSGKSDFLIGMDKEDLVHGEIKLEDAILDINEVRLNVIQKINYLTSKYLQNYKYVYFVGNDCVFMTKDWENIFLEEAEKNKYCVYYGDDGIWHDKLCTHALISSNIIKDLGFMGPECLKHMYVDNFWLELGKNLNCLKYFPNIHLQHNHPIDGKSQTDFLYQQTQKLLNEDQKSFKNYMNSEFLNDVKKIK